MPEPILASNPEVPTIQTPELDQAPIPDPETLWLVRLASSGVIILGGAIFWNGWLSHYFDADYFRPRFHSFLSPHILLLVEMLLPKYTN